MGKQLELFPQGPLQGPQLPNGTIVSQSRGNITYAFPPNSGINESPVGTARVSRMGDGAAGAGQTAPLGLSPRQQSEYENRHT